jgi:hypothetical protein
MAQEKEAKMSKREEWELLVNKDDGSARSKTLICEAAELSDRIDEFAQAENVYPGQIHVRRIS